MVVRTLIELMVSDYPITILSIKDGDIKPIATEINKKECLQKYGNKFVVCIDFTTTSLEITVK